MKTNSSDNFIEKSKLIHNHRYDYSLVNYINNNTLVKIICPTHGVFEQLPRTHISGTRCKKCVFDSYRGKDDFLKKSYEIHGYMYDYSLINYINSNNKIKIICPTHGIFEQSPTNHMRGYGCKKCLIMDISNTKTKKFIDKSKLIHNNKYNYSLVRYDNKDKKVNIICPNHGEYKQTPNNHIKGKGCPYCNESKGEKIIRNWLINNEIIFNTQHKFKDCKSIRPLPFDFYIPDLNICIEFNGRQHYQEIIFFGGETGLKSTQERDLIKIDYCVNNNIKIVIIKYDDDIIKILEEHLK